MVQLQQLQEFTSLENNACVRHTIILKLMVIHRSTKLYRVEVLLLVQLSLWNKFLSVGRAVTQEHNVLPAALSFCWCICFADETSVCLLPILADLQF